MRQSRAIRSRDAAWSTAVALLLAAVAVTVVVARYESRPAPDAAPSLPTPLRRDEAIRQGRSAPLGDVAEAPTPERPEPRLAVPRTEVRTSTPDPDKAEQHAALARDLLLRGRKVAAERHLRRAVRLDPENPRRYGELAVLEHQLHHEKVANRQLGIALRLANGGRTPETGEERLRALVEALKRP